MKLTAPDLSQTALASRAIVWQLRAQRFSVAETLSELWRLEANSLAYIRENDLAQHVGNPEDSTQLVDFIDRQIERLQPRRDICRERAVGVTARLYELVAELAATLPREVNIQELCEELVALPLPQVPPLGSSMTNQSEIAAWLEVVTSQDVLASNLTQVVVLDQLLQALTAMYQGDMA